jgi:uncharacterized DUF497 family protein
MFDWDELKRRSNLDKHGLDFLRAIEVFDGRPMMHLTARHQGELRYLTVGILDDVAVTVIWTWRGTSRRLISARRARREEREAYRQLLGR